MFLLLPVLFEVRYPAQAVWRQADTLRIAKWENAWDGNGNLRQDFLETYVNEEVDRFRVRVLGELPPGNRTVFLATTGSEGGDHDDPPTQITLNPVMTGIVPHPDGTYASKPMILVADEFDNAFKNDELVNDQTHLAALGSSIEVCVSSSSAPPTLSVPVETKATLDVALKLIYHGETLETDSFQYVQSAMRVAKEVYAQTGTEINFTLSWHAIDHIAALSGVDLTNGLTIEHTVGAGVLAAEAADVVNTLKESNDPDVVGIVVQGILNGPTGSPSGKAIWDNTEILPHLAVPNPYWSNATSESYKGTFFVSTTTGDALTVAHEIGHILGLPHVQDEKPPNNSSAPGNLLDGYNVIYAEAFYDSKRFKSFQEERIMGSQFIVLIP